MARVLPRVCIRAWVLAAVYLLPFTAAAQSGASPLPQTLSLAAALEIMQRDNPLLLRQRQGIAAARAGLTEARQRPNPQIDLNSESYPLFGDRPGAFFNNQELSFRASQTLETAGKRGKRTGVARLDVSVADAEAEDTLRQLKLELKRRYYGVVLAQAQKALAGEMLDQFDRIVRLTGERYRQGDVSGLELSRTRTERQRFFNDLVDARLEETNAKTALLELLGAGDLAAEFEVAETLDFTPLTVDAQQAQKEALLARPDLAAARQAAQRNARQLQLERANAVPNVTATVGYKRDTGVNTPVAGLSLAVPLFNRNQGGIARAAAAVEAQKQEVSRVSLAVVREVHTASSSLAAQEEKVRALRDDYVPNARRAHEIAQESYRLGALGLIELLDAERAYRETLRTYNQALYEYKSALFALEAATGKEF